MSDDIKTAVLRQLSSQTQPIALGKAKYAFGQRSVHVRFCSTNSRAPNKFKFNINPNSLSADYEVWICGAAGCYYLISLGVVQAMYHHSAAYPDRAHPDIRVVSVDVDRHTVRFARDTAPIDLRLSFMGSPES
jgi:hypothetical protein